MKTVAERLSWARTTAGLSQRRLSLLAGLSTRHVCALEDGVAENRPIKKGLKGHMREATVKALARVLGVSVSWLAYGQGRRASVRTIVEAVALAEREFAATDPALRRKAS